MSSKLFIKPSRKQVEAGLDAWSWLPLEGKKPFAVTSFGDVFFQGSDGVWFLDTVQGSLANIAATQDELKELLAREEAQDHYLMAGLVEYAQTQGLTLAEGQCYDFSVNPVLGGEIEFDNLEVQDFVVSLNIAGQIHEQVKDLPEGASISDITIE